MDCVDAERNEKPSDDGSKGWVEEAGDRTPVGLFAAQMGLC